MEVVVGILALGGLAGALYLLQRGVSRGITVASGAVTGNTRKRGLAAAHLQTDFAAPVPGRDLIARIRDTLELGTPAAQGLELGGISEDGSQLLIEQTKGWTNHLQFIVDTETDETGCTGRAIAAKWMESDGQITTTENIERIHKHVRSAVDHFGGTHSESTGQ